MAASQKGRISLAGQAAPPPQAQESTSSSQARFTMAVNSTIFLADTELRVAETAGSVTERIARNGSLADEVRITYGITGDAAVAGQDFVGDFGTATIPAGAAEASVPVQLLDDTLAENTELFVFSLVNVEGGTLWAPRTSRISILDDEAPAPPPDPEPPLASDYDVRRVPVVGGLDEPIRFEFSPVDASRVYVAEKDGIIRVADTASGASSVVLDIRDRVNAHQDRGLLDIALHPDFTGNPYIYAFVVVDPGGAADLSGNAGLDGAGNRYAQVLRFAADPATGYSTVLPGSEAVLAGRAGRSLGDVSGGGREDFTSPDFAGATASDRYIDTGAPPQAVVGGFKQNYIKVDSASHAGGALAFGPDGALFVSTGDGTSFDYADPRTPDVQSLDSLSGKILRIDPLTGLGLVDNPFAGTDAPLDSNRAKVWQYGLRNPFSMAFDGEGRLFVTNTGWNSWEAIDIGGPGANFGWPFYEGATVASCWKRRRTVISRPPGRSTTRSAGETSRSPRLSGRFPTTAPTRASKCRRSPAEARSTPEACTLRLCRTTSSSRISLGARSTRSTSTTGPR